MPVILGDWVGFSSIWCVRRPNRKPLTCSHLCKPHRGQNCSSRCRTHKMSGICPPIVFMNAHRIRITPSALVNSETKITRFAFRRFFTRWFDNIRHRLFRSANKWQVFLNQSFGFSQMALSLPPLVVSGASFSFSAGSCYRKAAKLAIFSRGITAA